MKEIINNSSASLVDVRTPGEYMMGHVEGSVNIPMDSIPEKIEELKAMSKPLVVFCASGNRSGQVQRYLESQGISDIHNGGGWMEVKSMLD